MVTMECKAGIGTSSRALPGLGTVGVLVLANFGGLDQLRLGGVAVGTTLAAERAAAERSRRRGRELHRCRRHGHPP